MKFKHLEKISKYCEEHPIETIRLARKVAEDTIFNKIEISTQKPLFYECECCGHEGYTIKTLVCSFCNTPLDINKAIKKTKEYMDKHKLDHIALSL